MKKIIEQNDDSLESIKTEMSEQEIDAFIQEVFERRMILDEVNSQVMQTIKRGERKSWLRKWGRVVALSFGLPLLATFIIFTVYQFVMVYCDSPCVVASCIFSVLLSIVLISKAIMNFKLGD